MCHDIHCEKYIARNTLSEIHCDNYGAYFIRAAQGHSIRGIQLALICGDKVLQLNPGEVCCHGTYECFVESILRVGLLAGGLLGQVHRRDIHFGTQNPGVAVISGMRGDADVAVYVDLVLAASHGIEFYRSINDVILTQGNQGFLPPQYITSIWHIWRGEYLYLPASVQDHPHPEAPVRADAMHHTGAYLADLDLEAAHVGAICDPAGINPDIPVASHCHPAAYHGPSGRPPLPPA